MFFLRFAMLIYGRMKNYIITFVQKGRYKRKVLRSAVAGRDGWPANIIPYYIDLASYRSSKYHIILSWYCKALLSLRNLQPLPVLTDTNQP